MTFANTDTHGASAAPQGATLRATGSIPCDLTEDTIRIDRSLEATSLEAMKPRFRAAQPSPATRTSESMDRKIARHVCSALAGMFPLHVPHARRSEERFPYPRLIRLIPSDEAGTWKEEQEITVVGKTLSEHGVGFFHPGPLPHRWVIVQLALANGGRISLLLQLLWCRFLREGWYESGGRFRRLMETEEGTAG